MILHPMNIFFGNERTAELISRCCMFLALNYLSGWNGPGRRRRTKLSNSLLPGI